MGALMVVVLASGWGGDAAVDAAAGMTSNVQRVREGGETDTLVALSVTGHGSGLGERLRGALDVDARLPLGLSELRRIHAHGAVIGEQPFGAMRLGGAVSVGYEDEVTVFVQAGSLPAGAVVEALSGYAQPFLAIEEGALRLEAFGRFGARSISGAEAYSVREDGGGASARWSPSGLLTARIQGLVAERRFAGLPVRTRDGRRPTTERDLELGLVEASVDLGTAPFEGFEALLGYVATRAYDTAGGFQSSVGHEVALQASWLTGWGLTLDADARLASARYDFRVPAPRQPTKETSAGVAAGVGWAVSELLEPRAGYEQHRAATDVDGTLYVEHVGLVGVRGRL